MPRISWSRTRRVSSGVRSVGRPRCLRRWPRRRCGRSRGPAGRSRPRRRRGTTWPARWRSPGSAGHALSLPPRAAPGEWRPDTGRPWHERRAVVESGDQVSVGDADAGCSGGASAAQGGPHRLGSTSDRIRKRATDPSRDPVRPARRMSRGPLPQRQSRGTAGPPGDTWLLLDKCTQGRGAQHRRRRSGRVRRNKPSGAQETAPGRRTLARGGRPAQERRRRPRCARCAPVDSAAAGGGREPG